MLVPESLRPECWLRNCPERLQPLPLPPLTEKGRNRFHVRNTQSKERRAPKHPDDFRPSLIARRVQWIHSSSQGPQDTLIDVYILAVPGSFPPNQKRDVTTLLAV